MTPRQVSRQQAVQEIRAAAAAHPGETVWIGIDGFGGSGKSSLADAVAAAEPRAVVVRVDDFWGPHVAEWDWTRFRGQVLSPLLAERPARYQVWNWVDDVGGEWVDIAPGHVVLVEGVSATRAEAGVPWDLTAWVDAPREVRLARALERDGPQLMHRWHDDWLPSEDAYAERERPTERVDLIVTGVE